GRLWASAAVRMNAAAGVRTNSDRQRDAALTLHLPAMAWVLPTKNPSAVQRDGFRMRSRGAAQYRTPGWSVFVFVFEKEIPIGGIIRPDFLHVLVRLIRIFQLLEILDHLGRSPGPHGVIDELLLRGGPWSLIKIRSE